MKRTVFSAGIGAALLAITVPAGAVIGNQIARPHLDDTPAVAAAEPPATTGPEEPVPAPPAPPTSERPIERAPTTTEPAREPAAAPSTTAPPAHQEPRAEVPAAFPLECGPFEADRGVVFTRCHWSPGESGRDLGAARFEVWRSTDGGERSLLGRTERTTWDDKGTEPGHTYRYGVVALDGAGATVGSSSTSTVVVPPKPVSLSMNCVRRAAAPLAVVCEWGALNRPDVVGYQVLRRIGEGPRTVVTTIPVGSPRRFVDEQVVAGQTITYFAFAVDAQGTLLGAAGQRLVVEAPAPTTAAPHEPTTTTRPASEPVPAGAK